MILVFSFFCNFPDLTIFFVVNFFLWLVWGHFFVCVCSIVNGTLVIV